MKTEPRKERYVQCQLRDLGIDTYFPLLKNFRKYMRKCQPQIEPFFPGYLFVYIDREPDLFHLRQVRGLNYVVSFDGQPARLEPGIVEEFRRREDGKGYICIRLVKREIPLHAPVRIVEGPFAGHRGLFVRYLESSQRICVLMDILKPQTLLELPLGSIAAELSDGVPQHVASALWH
ncbi:MAG: hypothetical protein HY236_11640 [Acidobacteria bacterium]|nr:hypothetical protein [Acidobacteriota bacterium]